MSRMKKEFKNVAVDFPTLFRLAALDFTHAVVEKDCGTRLGYDFDIDPDEFLSFAKSDRKEGGKRGKVNALSNAKRAIDSQIDRIFKSIGYDVRSLPPYFSEFVKEFCDESADIPFKLRIINAFGIAPGGVISDIRTLRNKTEHEYMMPTEVDVKNAVEIAELFLSATERHLMDVWDFEISDTSRPDGGRISGIYFTTSKPQKAIEASYPDWQKYKSHTCLLKPTQLEHAIIMRMSLLIRQDEEVLKSLKYLLRKQNHPIPENEIKLRQLR
jgi:hypothetical protein